MKKSYLFLLLLISENVTSPSVKKHIKTFLSPMWHPLLGVGVGVALWSLKDYRTFKQLDKKIFSIAASMWARDFDFTKIDERKEALQSLNNEMNKVQKNIEKASSEFFYFFQKKPIEDQRIEIILHSDWLSQLQSIAETTLKLKPYYCTVAKNKTECINILLNIKNILHEISSTPINELIDKKKEKWEKTIEKFEQIPSLFKDWKRMVEAEVKEIQSFTDLTSQFANLQNKIFFKISAMLGISLFLFFKIAQKKLYSP